MKVRVKWKQVWTYNLLALGLFGFTIFFLIKFVPNTVDIKVHNTYLIDMLAAGKFPIPPGYYLLNYIFDLVFHYKYPFVLSSFLILTFFLWWKYYLTYRWVSNELQIKPIFVFGLSMSCMFLGPIFIPAVDGDFWYLGKFTQTIWHNSTLIASFPFCILLFKKTFDWLESNKRSDFLTLLILSLVIVLIKPSFLFCYVPVLPAYVLLREKRVSALVVHALVLSVIILFWIFLEKFLIYSWSPMLMDLDSGEEATRVVIKPFLVWLHFSDQPIFDFLSSFPTLLFYFIFWKKKAFESQYFTFSFLLFICALAVYALFAETGLRQLHGNFYWQIPVTLFLTHLSILFVAARSYLNSSRSMSLKVSILMCVFVLQFVFGLVYWFRTFIDLTLS